MYAKIFDTILRSSIWVNHPPHVRVAWIGLLLLARPGRLPDGRRVGIVQGTRAGLARALSLELEQFEEALEVLMAPDPDSTSTEFEGRRIIELKPNRWAVVNYSRYQRMRDEDNRRIQSRELMRELREARRGGGAAAGSGSSWRSADVGTRLDGSTTSARNANNANSANTWLANDLKLAESTTSARCANNANIANADGGKRLSVDRSLSSARNANNANNANIGSSANKVAGDRNPDAESAILARSGGSAGAILAPPAGSKGAGPEFSTGFPQDTVLNEQVVDCVGDVPTFSTAFPQVFHSFSTTFPQPPNSPASSRPARLHKNECSAYYYDKESTEISQESIVVGDMEDRGGCKGGKGGKGVVTYPASQPKHTKPKRSTASSIWVLQPGEEPVMNFPCEGEADTWALSPSGFRWLQEHYRTVDVEAELRSAKAWLVGNPGRLKTARGMPRFLVNWMEKAARDRRGYRRQPDLLAGVEDLLKGAGEGGDE